MKRNIFLSIRKDENLSFVFLGFALFSYYFLPYQIKGLVRFTNTQISSAYYHSEIDYLST